MDTSKDTMNSFKHTKESTEKSHGIDLSVNVLAQAAWPTYPEVPVNLPETLGEYLEAFREYYQSKQKGRKLLWRHSLANCVLKANFPRGNKELVVSAFQAIVLLLFADLPNGSSLTYKAIEAATGLPTHELDRTLQSIACGKYRVLSKTPKGRDINPTDSFTINPNFKDEKFRIKINQIQLKETPEEVKETHEAVERDRKLETQAAIIRIMKSRKQIRHQELIQEVIEQTKKRGVLPIPEIKQNIDMYVSTPFNCENYVRLTWVVV